MQPLVNITGIQGSGFAWQSAKWPISGINSADVARFWAKVRQAPNGCLEWTGSRTGGRDRALYGQFTYTKATKQVHVYAHRFAWMLAHGPIPDGQYICHTCDHGLCLRLDHLFAGTQFDNMRDASAKGRLHVPKVRNRERVAAIREKWLAGGVSQIDLATEYGVHPVQISRWLKAVKQRPFERRKAS